MSETMKTNWTKKDMTTGTKIKGGYQRVSDGPVEFVDEDGMLVSGNFVASEAGETLVNVVSQKFAPVMITDYGDGRAEYAVYRAGTEIEMEGVTYAADEYEWTAKH